MFGWAMVQVATAAPVVWVDWTAGTAGANGTATGVIHAATGDIDVDYAGQIAFLQTAGGTNYWSPSAPYVSATVDNAPGDPDILALSTATEKTLTFSEPVDNLFFAVVSLNGNGYRFDSDFEIVSFGAGFWGNGTLTRVDNGDGTYSLLGTGEPHGVIRFDTAVSSITWDSLSDEFWNGFTVGTYGAADADGDGVTVPDDLCPGEDASGFDDDADGCIDDTDGDGIYDPFDLCPQDDASGRDADADGCVDDTDGDGIADDTDNCPLEDATGFDQDTDGCIDDTDGDGVFDPDDACPTEDATGQDGDGDGCIDGFVDTDGDGVEDGVDDCPTVENPGQIDADGDLVGDACELVLTLTRITGNQYRLTVTDALFQESVRFYLGDAYVPANQIRRSVAADATGTAILDLRIPNGTSPTFRAFADRGAGWVGSNPVTR